MTFATLVVVVVLCVCMWRGCSCGSVVQYRHPTCDRSDPDYSITPQSQETKNKVLCAHTCTTTDDCAAFKYQTGKSQ